MTRLKHKLGGKKGVFIRFRSGFRLFVQPNIQEKIKEVVKKLKSYPDHKAVFQELIEDIKDGSGAGIHPDSTWYSTTREIFEGYRRWEGKEEIDSQVKEVLIGFLEITTKNKATERLWDEDIKPFLLENIDTLSQWSKVKKHRGSFFGEIKRDKKGEYYYLGKGTKVRVMGSKTKDEERFEYVADDATRKFGLVWQLLSFTALLDIAYQYKNSPNTFSGRMFCLLPDNDYSSAYLHWICNGRSPSRCPR